MNKADPTLEQSSLTYYEERAQEYDELYILGKRPSLIPDPELYRGEVKVLTDIAGKISGGDLLDLACGTAFWLPYYAAACRGITLFDQSEAMLAEAEKKVIHQGVQDKTRFITGKFFNHDFQGDSFDVVLIGFFYQPSRPGPGGGFFPETGGPAEAGRTVSDFRFSLERVPGQAKEKRRGPGTAAQRRTTFQHL